MRNRHYETWVKTLPCAICHDDTKTDPHHLKGGGGGGIGFKETDFWLMPLCRTHHAEGHQIGWGAWEKQYGCSQYQLVCETIKKAIYEGVLNVCNERCR